jgi:hypothetical protein
LTDQGSEYRGAFDQVCRQAHIRHTWTCPRQAWTNEFVERLRGAILTELWRIELRRRFFTNVARLRVALDRYLGFHNHQQPHLGYRTRGWRPAELFGRSTMSTSGQRDVYTPMRNRTY